MSEQLYDVVQITRLKVDSIIAEKISHSRAWTLTHSFRRDTPLKGRRAVPSGKYAKGDVIKKEDL